MSITLIGQRKRKTDWGWRVKGVFQFTGTNLTGDLPIDTDCQYLDGPPVFTPIGALAGGSQTFNIPIGALSASADEHVTFKAPFAGTVTAVTITSKEGIAAAGTNFFGFGLLNKTATLTPVDIATLLNTTNTSGLTLVAYAANALVVNPTAAQVVIAAGDVLEFSVVHNGTPGTAQTEASVAITIQATGGVLTDEQVYPDVASILQTSGQSAGRLIVAINSSLSPVSLSLPVARKGTNVTSGLYVGFEYDGSSGS